MALVSTTLVILIILTTTLHYEVLRFLSIYLPRLTFPSRAKLAFVIFVLFGAHSIEVLFYGVAAFVLTNFLHLGELGDHPYTLLSTCLYFSMETFTSLGYGDIVPSGPLRFLAGVEALNGLLLIGWSASYTYISMEKYWNAEEPDDP
jgi:hypothetical protein